MLVPADQRKQELGSLSKYVMLKVAQETTTKYYHWFIYLRNKIQLQKKHLQLMQNYLTVLH